MKSSKVHRRRGSILAAVGVATVIVERAVRAGGTLVVDPDRHPDPLP
jgi:hypothetical protein